MEAQMGALTAQGLPRIKFTRNRRKELGYVEVRGPSGPRFKITGLYIAGRRVRRFFRTAQEAKTFLEAQACKEETLGIRARSVDGRLHEQAAEADLMLRPFGICLLDAVREWIRASSALRAFPGVSIGSAAETEAKRLAERAQSWTFAEAKDAWLTSRREKGRTDVYLNDANKRLARFAETYGIVNLADISAEAIERWLHELGLSPQSRMNFRSVLRAVFNFAVKKNRAPRNPVVDVEPERVVRDEPGILTPAELRRLLAVLPVDTIPFVTIQAFAGLRPTEVRRLDWRNVNLATGRIRLERKARRRNAPASSTCRRTSKRGCGHLRRRPDRLWSSPISRFGRNGSSPHERRRNCDAGRTIASAIAPPPTCSPSTRTSPGWPSNSAMTRTSCTSTTRRLSRRRPRRSGLGFCLL